MMASRTPITCTLLLKSGGPGGKIAGGCPFLRKAYIEYIVYIARNRYHAGEYILDTAGL